MLADYGQLLVLFFRIEVVDMHLPDSQQLAEYIKKEISEYGLNLDSEAEDMVVSLSSFFRLVLSHGQEFITIADEERHILSYLQIQQVRFQRNILLILYKEIL